MVTNKKRQAILQTAHRLFWKYGFKRVSIEEICESASVSKVTFYKFFANKIELAKAVFDEVVDEGRQKFRRITAESVTSEEWISKILLLKMEGTNDVSEEFLQDFYGNPDLGLKTYVEEKTASEWNNMLQELRLAQEKGFLRKNLNVEFFYLLAQKTGETLTDNKFLRLFSTPQQLVMELANFFAYGMSPQGQGK
jgi:AcrR family transcriptional regulator